MFVSSLIIVILLIISIIFTEICLSSSFNKISKTIKCFSNLFKKGGPKIIYYHHQLK